ncbi:MAG: hypothetical protein H5T85_00445 [Actinobacteria bacterium]|nr:hypothetical protein [Actinomycetota bacterium]
MVFLLIFSIILIWLQISNLRFALRVNNDRSLLESARKLEENLPEQAEKEFSLRSFPALSSLALIFSLNLLEISYFVYCVYLFNDFIITVGSSILAGYAIYSLIKFFPNARKFFTKPFEYLKEKTQGFENILNLVMTFIEILFCGYVLVNIISKYNFFL